MNTNTKIIVILVLCCLVGGILYMLNQKLEIDPNQTNFGSVIDTQNNDNTKPGTVFNETINKAHPKATSLTLQKTETPYLSKADTSWKTRSLQMNDGTMVTYVFGEGNPELVALSQKEIDNLPLLARQKDIYYITPEKEKKLKNLLENDDFYSIVNACFNEMNSDYVSAGSSYLFPRNLNMENILYIDATTGRKRFNQDIIMALLENFTNLKSPVSDKWKNCINQSESYKIDAIHNELSVINDKIRELPMESSEQINRIPYPLELNQSN